jgi:DNA-3-methyladenine glycosylase
MTVPSLLPRSFYSRDTVTVARELLGKALVRRSRDGIWMGMISETEAYGGAEDSASHARHGRTSRNAPMFGPAGWSYVYFVYGMHHMFNVVTEKSETAGAVLIRALQRLEPPAHTWMQPVGSTDGPAKLCRVLQIDRKLNHWDLTLGKRLWLESRRSIPDRYVKRGPRVGITYASEADRRTPRRFRVEPSWWTAAGSESAGVEPNI